MSEEAKKNVHALGKRNSKKDFSDVTLFGTPVPQAASTAKRNSNLPPKFGQSAENYRRSLMNETTDTFNSSLGLLHNISTLIDDNFMNLKKQSAPKKAIDTERELARKLLQKCSEPIIKNEDKTNKENDANEQNRISEKYSGGIKEDFSTQSLPVNEGEKNTLFPETSMSSSVLFEPREITARSSEMSKISGSFLPNTSSKAGFSMNSTAAEMIAQFGQEDFRSDSRAINQLEADELSWRENYSYAMPLGTNNSEKEHLEFSCFSGIIGDVDLTVESDSGHKLSFGEYFKRKCGNFGELSESEAVDRPSFGFSIRSPKKREIMEPLINITGMTNATEACGQKEMVNNFSSTVDMTKESLMSLSSIAQVLENINDGTPRKLVDQLIMANKKRKEPQAVSDTYTVMSFTRNSMPASSSNTLEAEKHENDSSYNDRTLKNQSNKFSLDSRTLQSCLVKNRSLTLTPTKEDEVVSPKPRILSSTAVSMDLSKLKDGKNELSFPETKPIIGKSNQSPLNSPREGAISPISKYENLKEIYIKKGSPMSERYNENPSHSLTGTNPSTERFKNEKSSINKDSSFTSTHHSSLEENIIIGKKTQELCMCVVGIRKEIDLDVMNKSDRWITLSVILNQIQGDGDAIEFFLPVNVLVNPNSSGILKIEVKILKTTTPIIAVLNIRTTDFVTQSKWDTKYIICFVSEELQIDVLTPANKMELNFEAITQNGHQILPITFENKNCIDLPLLLFILQDEPNTFSIKKADNESTTDENSSNSKLVKFCLKSRESCTMNIEFQGVTLNLFEAFEPSNSLKKIKGKLVLQTDSNSQVDPGIVINEIPLFGSIGICKLRVINTELPIIIPKMQSRTLTFYNSGSIGIPLSAMIVENEGEKNEKLCDDFVVRPETLFLHCFENGSFTISYMPRNSNNLDRHVMVKITAGKNNSLYSVIGKMESSIEETFESFQCETLQHLRTISSPNSPLNRSPNSGRDSPGGSVSSSTIAGDVLPIRATHSSLAWTSIRVGKSDIKEFAIRNCSNNKIKLHASIISKDKSFKFVRDSQTTSNVLALTLQPAESKTIIVVFSPLFAGAATGRVLFQHYSHAKDNTESRPQKTISLFGYGGSTKLEISKAFKDTGGLMWLSLGKMSGGSLDAKIKLENLGDLSCYVKLKLIPKAVYPSMAVSWSVEPSKLLLNPKEAQWVCLEFRPRKEDLRLLGKNTVSHVGTLKLTYGDEPTRLRIRRLFYKMKESAPKNMKDQEFWNEIHPICKAFPGETFIRDLTLVRDSNTNLGDLCRGINYQELKLTVESSADETMTMLQDDMDETQTFYSLCSDSCNDITVTGDSYLPVDSVLEAPNQHYIRDIEDAFIVHPSEITLNASSKNEATIVISTNSKVAQPFETVLSNGQNCLTVVPNSGMIPTGRSLSLKVECRKQVTRNFETVLKIYTANDKRDVTIRVYKDSLNSARTLSPR
ncbi:uncharacterized protein LOC122501361 isoform X2 [Leptopilina heterotoma]|uniref:uncharacterized protein LOC122501361 isoform X2 n=1 Tax=Leptopilina heterotoma TaxID=63436 RepID=UPI001CA8C249|nr:uncharacterized protein LOC122501361 isoform X2 [Leptopilina heterotoma]